MEGNHMRCRRVAMLVAPACSGANQLQSNEDGITTVRISAAQTFNTALPSLLVEGDFPRQFGLDFERVDIAGSGSSNQLAAVLSGDADLAGAGSNSAIDAFLSGADVQIIASYGEAIQSLVVSNAAIQEFGVDVTASPIDRVRALRGMTIASSPPGSAGNAQLRVVLSDAGLDLERDVTLVPLADSNGAVAAGLERGSFDATWATAGSGEVVVARDKATRLISVPAGEAPALDGYVCNVIFAPTRFIEQHQDVVDRIRQALAEATRLTQDEPQRAGEILKKSVFSGMDPAVFDLAWSQAVKGYRLGNTFTRDDWDAFVRFFDKYSDHDYAAANYDDFINSVARGEG
ncbi:ABC transporter substrate-binding protein [Rhodococcus koreensis]|uniref:ABC transporter substrate-binding protein n=1 Tax=Rhodococcus koreensis TaxID=99653 RepID=UPI003670D1FA